MDKIDVWHFCSMFFQCKHIEIHGWSVDECGNERWKHMSFTDQYDYRIMKEFKNYRVTQFKVLKKGFLDIIACEE